jgi:hypothetical protein
MRLRISERWAYGYVTIFYLNYGKKWVLSESKNGSWIDPSPAFENLFNILPKISMDEN